MRGKLSAKIRHGFFSCLQVSKVNSMTPAAPALATDQYTDSFSKVDAIVIFVPIIVVWIAFLEWDSKQPSADDVTGYGYLGKTIDGPTEDKPAYFRRSPENG